MTDPTPAAGGNRRGLAIALGILVAIILAFLLLTLTGGDGEDTAGPTTTRRTGTTRAPVTSTTAPGAPAPESFEVFNTKNPFIPLRGGTGGGTGSGSGSGSGGGGGGGSGGGGGTIGGGTTQTTTRTGGTTGTTSRTGGTTGTTTNTGGGGGNEPARSQRISLMDVFSENGRVVANVRVNDTVYKVSAGQVFAGSFKVLSLSQADGCGRFLYGDDQFRICEGEQVVK